MGVISDALNRLIYEDHWQVKQPETDFWSSPVRGYELGPVILKYMQNVILFILPSAWELPVILEYLLLRF